MPVGGCSPTLLSVRLLIADGGLAGRLSLFGVRLSGLLLGRNSKSVEVQRFRKFGRSTMTVYGSWLRLMMLGLLPLFIMGVFRQPGRFGPLLLSLPWQTLIALLGALWRTRAWSWGCEVSCCSYRWSSGS